MRFGLQNTFEWPLVLIVATSSNNTVTICIAKLAVATAILAAKQVACADATAFSSFVIKWVLLVVSSQSKSSSYVATYVYGRSEDNASTELSLDQWASTERSFDHWVSAREEGKIQTFGVAAAREIWMPLSHRSDVVVWVADYRKLMLV